jgi:DNA-binding transcriptional regulator PaaX
LWQALRAHRLGLLQRSVWVWPHDVTPILREIIQVEGVPECFCGFKATEVFLCTDEEIVGSSWAWEEITRRQQSYLRHLVATESAFKAARDPVRLGELARVEKRAYDHAMLWDPLLPQTLWPAGYLGRAVHQRHQRLRALLGARLAEMANL